jgi:hypothetical protein
MASQRKQYDPRSPAGAGGMDVVTSARQMRRAWDSIFGEDADVEPLSDWQRIWARERALLGCPTVVHTRSKP